MKRATIFVGPLVAACLCGAMPVLAQSTPPGAMTWAFGYDPMGNRQTAVDPLGLTSQWQYDRLSRATQITQPLPAAGVARPLIQQGWDLNDQLTGVTDPRNLLTSYVRDGLGNTPSQTSPDTGSSGATFDAAGNRVSRTDARGKLVLYTYDALNRLTKIDYPTGVDTVIEYDGGTVTPKPANSQGRLTKLTDESGTTSYSYNAFGNVTQKVQVVTAPGQTASKTFTAAYGWDGTGAATGKLSTLTYPSGARLVLSYGSNGLVSGATVNPVNTNGSGTNTASSQTVLSLVTYTAWNEPQGWTWGGGVSYSRSWDSFARPLTYPLGNPAGTGTAAGMVRTVGYDDAGRITAYTHVRGTTAQTAFDQTFSYDGLGRITVASQGAATYAYTYDASGNRLSYRVATTTFTNTVSATSNRLATVQRVNTSGATVTDTASYDLAGNTLSNGSAGSAVYSDRGRLATANVPITGGSSAANYRYNALEQRLAKAGALVSTGVAYYVYDEAGHVLGEYDINGIPLYEVIWLEDRPVAIIKQTRTGSGATLAVSTRIDDIYADHLNTPRVIARGTDHAILWRWESTEVFGVTPANENPNALGAYTFNLRFPGQIYDKETTGHYNWNRDYSSWVGRYMQSDPIGLQGGINTYVYVGGNSISFVDPTGLICTYSQSSGAMSCTNAGGQNYYNASGYAGTGAGRNNHDAQGQGNVGPLPRGDWQATGNWYNSPNTGRNTIRLTPMPGNECGVTGRDCSSFRIHGNNASNDASHGCIVLPPNRTVIPPGEVIRVVP